MSSCLVARDSSAAPAPSGRPCCRPAWTFRSSTPSRSPYTLPMRWSRRVCRTVSSRTLLRAARPSPDIVSRNLPMAGKLDHGITSSRRTTNGEIQIMIPRRYFVSLAAILPWLSPWAFADSSDTKLEEIVVTAQKREQSFNVVGIAVSVLSSADIADAGIKTLVDVASQTPNLQMKNVLGNSITNVSIRGIGLNDYAVNNNPAAGIYVDNVYLVSPAMLTFGLFDIDRIA